MRVHKPHGRQGRHTQPPDAPLEELLRFEEDAAPVPVQESEPTWRLRELGKAFAISAVVYTGFRAYGYAAPYLLIASVAAASVLVRRAVKVASEPPAIRTGDLVRPPHGMRWPGPPGWNEGEDGMLKAVRRWDRRLDWGASAPERFSHTVPGRLGELVDERLRQRHGITRASDPGRARVLLGEDAWTFLHEPIRHVPTPRQLAAVVSRVEAL